MDSFDSAKPRITKPIMMSATNSKWVVVLYLYIAFMLLGQYQFNTVMRIFYAVLVLGVLVLYFRRLFRLDGFTSRLVLLIIYAFVSCFWASDIPLAFKGFISLSQCTLIAVSVYFLCDSENRIRNLLWCFVISVILFDFYVITTVGLRELAEMSQLGVRANMSDEAGINANSVGYMNALAIPLLLYLCNQKGKRVFLVLEVLFAASVIFSASRTAVMMLGVGFLLYAILIQRSKKMIGIVAGVALALVVISILASQGLLDTIFDRFGDARESVALFFNQGRSVSGEGDIRLRLIKGGLILWTRRPLFGYGLNQFSKLIQPMIGEALAPHNTYTQALVSFGIFGLFLWQGLYISALRKLWKKRTNMDIMLVILVIMWLVGDIFGHSMNNKTSFVLIGLCYARVLIKQNYNEKEMNADVAL